MNKLSSQDRATLLRLAAGLPQGSEERRTILAGLKAAQVDSKGDKNKEESTKEASAPGWHPVAMHVEGWHLSADAFPSEDWDPDDIEVFITAKVPYESSFNISTPEGKDRLNVLTGFLADFANSLRKKAGLRVASDEKPKGRLARLLEAEATAKTARRLFPDDCKPGKTYRLGYRSHTWTSTFVKWSLDHNGPRMHFKDVPDNGPGEEHEGGMEWEAYMYNGFMAVGSSADKLLVFEEVS